MTGSPPAGVLAPEAFAERLAWQEILYAARPRRSDLRALTPRWPLEPLTIGVHRNHAVEAALSVATPYLQFAGFEPEWIVGDYDDGLFFADRPDHPGHTDRPDDPGHTDRPARPNDAVDLEIVWLDAARFADRLTPAELARWLTGRLAALRDRTDAPILVLDSDGAAAGRAEFMAALQMGADGLRDVHVGDRADLFADLSERYFDPARESVTGTRMSAEAALAVGARLGAWIPGLIRPRLKAVVVDLDDTLHAGVLGEDGVAGVAVSDGHRELQRRLRELRESGMFLGLLSRNDRDQVEELFRARAPDFSLALDDFDATAISWEPKSRGLAAIATQLRIDPAAILFVDDNPGELLETALNTPGVHLLRASAADPQATTRAVAGYPGVSTLRRGEEDALRTADLRANAERERAITRADADPGAYHRELAVTLTLSHDRPDQLARLTDLSAKTNQFNLSLARLSAAEVERYILAADHQASAARLADRLTDSGVIAMLLARREGTTLAVAELCISCRAMGRRLEDLIVAQLLVSGPLFHGVESVSFELASGPRNQPARTWLETFSGTGETGTVVVDAARVRDASVNPDVRIEVQR